MEQIEIMEGFPDDIMKKLIQREKERNELPPYIKDKVRALVFEDLKLWQTGTLKVSFKGGDAALHKDIADTAKTWSKYANIRFDFGDEKNQHYRAWTPDDNSHIRVGFEHRGYWSFVGTDSQDTSIVKKGAITLNLSGFDKKRPTTWQGTVLHEFGHAIGFHHEHQTPKLPCDFDWDKVYVELAKPPNKWTEETVDFNLRQMPPDGLTFGPHDKHSIMHYSFEPWMFVKRENSPCYTKRNTTLSPEDQRMAAKAYPFNKEEFASQLLSRKEMLEDLLSLNAPGSEHFEKHLSYLKEDTSYREFFPKDKQPEPAEYA